MKKSDSVGADMLRRQRGRVTENSYKVLDKFETSHGLMILPLPREGNPSTWLSIVFSFRPKPVDGDTYIIASMAWHAYVGM